MHNLYLQRDYARTIHRIQKLKPDMVPQWGKMTAQQMVSHCTDLLQVALKEKTYQSDSSFFKKTFVKWYLLYGPDRWPRNLATYDKINPTQQAPSDSTFTESLHNYLEAIRKFYGLKADFVFPDHPVLGKLSHDQWGRVIWRHIDHHLRQFKIY